MPRRRTFTPPILGSAHSDLAAPRHPWLRRPIRRWRIGARATAALRVDQDQHADNFGAVPFDFYAIAVVGEHVLAAKRLLERSEEHLDQPAEPDQ